MGQMMRNRGEVPCILSTGCALPPYRYPQHRLTAAFADFVDVEAGRRRLLERVHGNAKVESRHLAVPLEEYAGLTNFDAANNAFITAASALSAEALRNALKTAEVGPEQVDVIMMASTTGLSVPSLDARIAPSSGLRPDVKRMPLVGLGCVAGAAGVARLADYLSGPSARVGVLVAVELCSLTLQRHDTSTANLIASGLFGDGAAAVVMTGPGARPAGVAADHELTMPAVLASSSRLYPHTERAMGWDVGSSGLRIVLGAEIPELIRTHLGNDVDEFLASQGLSRQDIEWWVCHPGGPKVLEAVEDTFDLHQGELGLTWDSLARIGNISSASVLHVLADTLEQRPPRPGSYGLMLAMGPGFSVELVLLGA